MIQSCKNHPICWSTKRKFGSTNIITLRIVTNQDGWNCQISKVIVVLTRWICTIRLIFKPNKSFREQMWCDLRESVGSRIHDIFRFLLIEVFIRRGTFCWKPNLNQTSGSKVIAIERFSKQLKTKEMHSLFWLYLTINATDFRLILLDRNTNDDSLPVVLQITKVSWTVSDLLMISRWTLLTDNLPDTYKQQTINTQITFMYIRK